jgi:hypothetical protein
MRASTGRSTVRTRPSGSSSAPRKDAAVARYALEGLPNKVLAAEYRTALPAERMLADEIKKTRRELERRGSPPDAGRRR